jgi:hypothetical protein
MTQEVLALSNTYHHFNKINLEIYGISKTIFRETPEKY